MWPYDVARGVVALAIGAGTGALLAAAVVIVKAGREEPAMTGDDGDGEVDGTVSGRSADLGERGVDGDDVDGDDLDGDGPAPLRVVRGGARSE